MARDESVVWVQLATRIPKSRHRDLKLHCVAVDTSVMDFVAKAIEEKLAGSDGRPAKGREEGVGREGVRSRPRPPNAPEGDRPPG